ncbi:hypothetical protein [Sinomicrobium sp.]
MYKTGGDFDSDYVEALHESLSQYGDFICFTDGDVPDYIQAQPLVHGWEGWWSKIEALGYSDDILLFDLDTVIVGDLIDMVTVVDSNRHQLIMLSDFYFPEKPASGIMYVPNELGISLYNNFAKRPDTYMASMRGDQEFIRYVLGDDIKRWDELLGDDYICSYKAHIIKSYPKHLKPKQVDVGKSKIICFHGKPRPKDVKDINVKL